MPAPIYAEVPPLDPAVVDLDQVLTELRRQVTLADTTCSETVAGLHRQYACYLVLLLDCAATRHDRLPGAWRA